MAREVLSSAWRREQFQLNILDARSQQQGLKILKGKAKIMRINQAKSNEVFLNSISLVGVELYTYLDSDVDKDGGLIEITKYEYKRQEELSMEFVEVKIN